MSFSDSDDDYDPEDVDKLYGELFDNEERWRDRAEFLQSRGYMLRTRLRPGWVPSWRGTDQDPFCCEDAISTPVRYLRVQ